MFLFLQLFYSIETFKVKSRHEKKKKRGSSICIDGGKASRNIGKTFFFFLSKVQKWKCTKHPERRHKKEDLLIKHPVWFLVDSLEVEVAVPFERGRNGNQRLVARVWRG